MNKELSNKLLSDLRKISDLKINIENLKINEDLNINDTIHILMEISLKVYRKPFLIISKYDINYFIKNINNLDSCFSDSEFSDIEISVMDFIAKCYHHNKLRLIKKFLSKFKYKKDYYTEYFNHYTFYKNIN